jgi:hypothetical protein
MTTTLHVSHDLPTRLLMPLCPPDQQGHPEPRFLAPEPQAVARPKPHNQWRITRDEMEQTVTVFRETMLPEHPIPGEGPSVTASAFERRWCTASDVDPARARLEAEGQRAVRRDQDSIVVNSWLTIESDETHFAVTVKREISENGAVIRSKSWQESIPRDHL